MVDFLSENDQFNVIIHGLSVGGYLGQRVLMGLHKNKEQSILKRVTHQVYDSFSKCVNSFFLKPTQDFDNSNFPHIYMSTKKNLPI